MLNDIVNLVTITGETRDRDGFVTGETEESLQVFASVDSTKRTEYYAALSAGIQIDLMITVNKVDYDAACIMVDDVTIHPSKVTVEEKVYRIVRSYHVRKNATYELTLQEVE